MYIFSFRCLLLRSRICRSTSTTPSKFDCNEKSSGHMIEEAVSRLPTFSLGSGSRWLSLRRALSFLFESSRRRFNSRAWIRFHWRALAVGFFIEPLRSDVYGTGDLVLGCRNAGGRPETRSFTPPLPLPAVIGPFMPGRDQCRRQRAVVEHEIGDQVGLRPPSVPGRRLPSHPDCRASLILFVTPHNGTVGSRAHQFVDAVGDPLSVGAELLHGPVGGVALGHVAGAGRG